MTERPWKPAQTRLVDSADALKALADPLRIKVLHLMMGAPERAWSVKELAGELKQPVTKLYHHIKLLEGAALITDVESRLVSGIVEHRYRTSQRSLQMDDSMFTSPETRDDSIAQVAALVDASKDALLDYLHGDFVDADEVRISRSTARLTAEEVETIAKTVEELIEKFRRARDDEADGPRAALPRSSMLVLFHPLAHDHESET
jgi:DNA-binding transcriptional ArsR family regulator